MNRHERRAQARRQGGRSLAKIGQHDAALAFARELIRRAAAPGGDGSLFEPMASRTFVRNFMRAGLEWADGRMWLVESALAGDDDAKSILEDVILELQSRRVEMPTEIAYYNMRLVRGVRLLGFGGPKKKDKFLRNISICGVVAAVVDHFSLDPTGRSVRRCSGCAVVGEALDVIGQRMSAKEVETIWGIYGRHLHLPPGWVAAMGPLPPKDQ
jgi:hypothetical protein